MMNADAIRGLAALRQMLDCIGLVDAATDQKVAEILCENECELTTLYAYLVEGSVIGAGMRRTDA